MKRFLCILMIFLILFLSSCNKESYSRLPIVEKEFEQLIEFYGSKEGEYESRAGIYHNWGCMNFEEGIYYINEIVSATYKTSWQVNGNYLHEFELDTSFKETEIPQTFYVAEMLYNDKSYSYHTFTDILFEKGEKYLLLLTRQITRDLVSEYFVFVYDRLEIKMTEDSKLDIENSTMCGESFYEKIKDSEIKKAIDENRFIEYLLEATKDHAKLRNKEAILKTLDFQSILFQSPNVVKVRIIESKVDGLISIFTRQYSYIVEEVYKGDMTVGEIENWAYLPAHIVNVGETYILALKQNGSTLSSRNSIYGIEMEDNVKAVLAEFEK